MSSMNQFRTEATRAGELYRCQRCAFATLSPEEFAAHWSNQHGPEFAEPDQPSVSPESGTAESGINSREHYEMLEHFEREYAGRRVDREPKRLWPMGVIYQDGEVNGFFLAYRRGYALAKAMMRDEAPPSASPETPRAPLPTDQNVVRHANGHLMVEEVPAYLPSEEAEAKALRSLAKARPYLVDHASHIDGEFDGALTDVRRMLAAHRAVIDRMRTDPLPSGAPPATADAKVRCICLAAEGEGHLPYCTVSNLTAAANSPSGRPSGAPRSEPEATDDGELDRIANRIADKLTLDVEPAGLEWERVTRAAWAVNPDWSESERQAIEDFILTARCYIADVKVERCRARNNDGGECRLPAGHPLPHDDGTHAWPLMPRGDSRYANVTDADVEAVEEAVGMGADAWDMVSPKSIIGEAWKRAVPSPVSTTTEAGEPAPPPAPEGEPLVDAEEIESICDQVESWGYRDEVRSPLTVGKTRLLAIALRSAREQVLDRENRAIARFVTRIATLEEELKDANRELDDIDRTLETAEIPTELPTGESLSLDDRVGHLSEARGNAEHQYAAALSQIERQDTELQQLRGVVWALSLELAKRELKLAQNDDGEWPGRQEWDDLVPTSHSIMRHRAWAASGLIVRRVVEMLCDNGFPKPYHERACALLNGDANG